MREGRRLGLRIIVLWNDECPLRGLGLIAGGKRNSVFFFERAQSKRLSFGTFLIGRPPFHNTIIWNPISTKINENNNGINHLSPGCNLSNSYTIN